MNTVDLNNTMSGFIHILFSHHRMKVKYDIFHSFIYYLVITEFKVKYYIFNRCLKIICKWTLD